jgi:hypothetical protein
MASTYKTPGVYIEEISKFPPSVAAVETAIPAFIGYTEKAQDKVPGDLTLKPFRITSLLEYETYFGGPQPETNLVVSVAQETDGAGTVVKENISVAFSGAASRHMLYYALQAFFGNGGGPCYIVSAGPYKAVGTALVYAELKAALDVLEKEDEPTLILFPEGQQMVEAEYYTLQNDSLAQCAKLQDRFAVMDLHHSGAGLASSAALNTAAAAFRGGINSPSLKYGAAYFPNVNSIFPYAYGSADVDVAVAVDGAAPATQTLAALEGSNSALASKVKASLAQFGVVLPPSAIMAGIYARVDSARGVWKAPANEGVSGLNSANPLTFKVTDDLQKDLNVDATAGKSINALRYFTGKGTLVWGARTLAGNDNEWRYISVRRFFNMVEESVKKATYQFVFEPNDANTWVKVRAMIENFLILQWRAGALAGAKPEQAFYVKVGLGETMTALDILEGRMNVEIGMAVVRPAEFIILKFSHKMQEA